ncbi:MAG: response regulator, partial [Planctomycetota bacterium]
SVLRALKADATLRHIPVVMVTIVGEVGRGFALGATDYLTKPVDRGLLVDAIRRYVGTQATPRVLIVEDDAMTRAILRRTLDEAGFAVDEAEHGAAGLAQVRATPPSIILLDLMMPVMDGFEFLSELRSDAAHSAIPVLVLTAKELSRDEEQFLNARAENVITKDADALDALVQQVRASLPTAR